MDFKEIRKKIFLTKEIKFNDLSDEEKTLYKKELGELPEDKLADELFLFIDNPFKLNIEEQVDAGFFSDFKHILSKYVNKGDEFYIPKWRAHKLNCLNDDIFNEVEKTLFEVKYIENGSVKIESWRYVFGTYQNEDTSIEQNEDAPIEDIKTRFRYERGFEPESIKELQNHDA